MTTRFNAVDQVNFNVPGVKSGYDGNIRSDLVIPPCGLEDVDVALFTLFDKEIAPSAGGKDTQELKRVPIVFAAGEKWAMLKRGRPLRDRNNTLILPLITIMRTSVSQAPDDITSRGINQQTGEIVVRRRLDKSDRDYQNLINRQLILNQANVAVTSGSQYSLSNEFITGRKTGDLSDDFDNVRGALLLTNRKNNIFETIVVPSPQFYTATYSVTIWTHFTQHMNQILEKIMSSYLPQTNSWKLTTTKGYWFVAKLDNGAYNVETNFEDMSTSERFIKCTFDVKVPAYVWASTAPGVPIPVKRYVSSPVINFEVENRSVKDATGPEEFPNSYLLGNDDPTLPLDEQTNARNDQRRPGWRQQVVQPSNAQENDGGNDPALTSYPRGVFPNQYQKIQIGNGNEFKYVKIVNVNQATGETVYSAADFQGLKITTS
jgi:hypothetical protein